MILTESDCNMFSIRLTKFVWKRSLKVLETKNSKDKMLSDLVLFKP